MIISKNERDAVYKTIFSRRDVRSEFTSEVISDDVLKRILTAAHHAPSVGFMQPWDFIVVKNMDIKHKIKEAFDIANNEASLMFENEKKDKYKSLKLEGILDAPIGICVTCDRSRNGPIVLGRTKIPEMDLYSTVCAIQNLWLAARAENIGVGWVSIIDNEVLKTILGIPEHIVPIAYLCMGHVSLFHEKPELEQKGWLKRENLDSLIHYDRWSKK